MLDHSSPLPLHAQAEQWLRSFISEPPQNHGGLLPDEVALAKRLSISRNTLRAAITRLVNDGLLERKRGVGTRILPPRTATGLGKWESFSREMAAKGVQVENFHIEARWEKAEEHIAQKLQIANESTVLHLTRLRGYDDSPVVLFESWFHPNIPLNPDADFQQPLYQLITAHCDMVPMRSQEEITAIAANRILAKKLQVPKNSPLLRRQRLVTDAGQRPMEYAVNHYRSDRFIHSLDLYRNIS